MPLRWQINEVVAETGWIVEYYLNERMEQETTKTIKGKRQKVTESVPKWTYDQIMSPDFNPDATPMTTTQAVQREIYNTETDDIDADDME